MTRWSILLVALAIGSQPVEAQGLRDQIAELFIFGDGDDPLFLSGTADPSNPFNIQVHGEHFIPAASASNATIISFLTNAIATNIANIPISATSSGTTFRFVEGAPVATSTSPGPIFAERGQTLGRGRVLVGATVNVFNFKSLRGVDLDDVRLTFTHENTNFPGCDQVFGGDCTIYGVPDFENDVITLDLDLDLNVVTTLFVLSYGLHDRIDIGVAIPIVSTSLRGRSTAEVIPFGGASVNHFFGGTITEPELMATRTVDASVSGLGDVAARVKIAVGESETTRFSILGDARFATGDEADLLGSGSASIRGLGIISAQFNRFSPHVNVGYVYRSAELQNDAVLLTAGFDHVLAPWAALAVDFVSEFQVRANKLTVPDPVRLEAPFPRTIEVTTIPDRRDDLLGGSIGFKFVTPSGLTLILNSIWPLNQAGLRTDVSWSAGLEYNF